MTRSWSTARLDSAWEWRFLTVAARQTVLFAGVNVKVGIENGALRTRLCGIHFFARQLTGAVSSDVNSEEGFCKFILNTINF